MESDLSRTRDTETISSREDRSDHAARYTLLMIAESSICEWESIYTPRSYHIHRKYRSRRYSDLDTGDLSDREMIVESGWYNQQKYENKSSKDTSTHRIEIMRKLVKKLKMIIQKASIKQDQKNNDSRSLHTVYQKP
jgi:hypothetical protein